MFENRGLNRINLFTKAEVLLYLHQIMEGYDILPTNNMYIR